MLHIVAAVAPQLAQRLFIPHRPRQRKPLPDMAGSRLAHRAVQLVTLVLASGFIGDFSAHFIPVKHPDLHRPVYPRIPAAAVMFVNIDFLPLTV